MTAPLTLHPDRLLPADAGTRAIAARLYEAVQDLPIVSPHGHVDPRLLVDDTPFADPTSLLLQPDHYVTRLLHANGVPLEDAGRRRRSPPRGAGPRRLAAALRPLARVPRHPGPVLVRQRTGRHLRHHATPVRGERGRPVRPDRRPARPAGVPAAGPVAPVRHRDPRHHRRSRRRPGRARRAGRRSDGGRPGCVPTFRPTAIWNRRVPGWSRGRQAARRSRRRRRRATIAATWRRSPSAAGTSSAHGATSADHSHLDARAEPLAPPMRSGSTTARMNGRVTRQDATAFRRHMLLEMARMSCDDGLVMTLHPAVRRNHHPATAARFGPGHRPRHPGCRRVHLGAAAAAGAVRHPPELPPGAVHRGRRPSSAARSRRSPGSTPPVYAGAPWWFLDNPAAIRSFHGAVTEIAGSGQAFRVHRRHPGVLLDPGPPRHVPPARRRFPGRPGRRAPPRRGRGRRQPDPTSSPTSRSGCSSCDDHCLAGPSGARRHPPGTARPDRPPGPRQLLPRPSGRLHRPCAGRRRVGDRGIHRPVAAPRGITVGAGRRCTR